MIKKIITGLIFTVILSTGALASDELYVKDDGCFVTKTLGIMDYLSLIYSQGDFEALSKALISGCNNGTILRMNSGKKCFLIKIVDQEMCAIRPEGSFNIYYGHIDTFKRGPK